MEFIALSRNLLNQKTELIISSSPSPLFLFLLLLIVVVLLSLTLTKLQMIESKFEFRGREEFIAPRSPRNGLTTNIQEGQRYSRVLGTLEHEQKIYEDPLLISLHFYALN